MRLLFCFLIAGGIGVVFILMVRLRRKARRRQALQQPFSGEWVAILIKNLPPYAKLSDAFRGELHDNIRIFLAEKSFEGCGGLVLTDEIRVTIAAQACMLLLNRADDCYPKLSSVLVYPSAYVVGSHGRSGKPEETSVRLGESWGYGTVVLAWDSVKHGGINFKDGRNVTLHEFAHQLDQEDGAADGAPILESRTAYASWAEIFSHEFLQLQNKKKKRKRSVFNKYGATNPAEFFAVVTESFFEKPKQFQKKHPELFDELQDYYKVNPIDWV